MKLTLVLSIVACLQVSARGYSQKVSLNGNNITLQRVFEEIKKQTGFQFFYAEETLQSANAVSLNLKKVSLEMALEAVFENQPLGYTISENTIIVKKKPAPAVTTTEMTPIPPAPVPPVTGKVTDDKGQPLEGASIVIKGTSSGTRTDAAGNFSIDAAANATLVISYVGYEAVEVKAGSSPINVQLKQQINSGESIVVVGYGTSKKKDLTGSISSVKGEEIAKQPSTNPIASLQGKVPGLTVANTGRAGASPVVRIRGINSTNSASPVYVVDGILQDNIDFLNPADIESIDILRDPSSIAIYGLRGANGVIAITSKKAARGQTRISLQSSIGMQTVHDKIRLTDGPGFRTLYAAQLANINAAPFDFTNYTASTDWQDLVLRTAMLTSTNLSISNSTDKATTYLNIGYTYQEGVLRNDDFRRYLARLNEEIRISKNLRVGGEISGYHYETDPPAASISNALWAAPIVPVQLNATTYYSMPSFQRAQVGNPIATLNRNDNNSVEKGYRLIGSLFAEVKFLKDLTWKSTVYGDLWFNTARSYVQLPFSFINLGEGAAPTTTTIDNSIRTSITQEQSETKRYQQDHTLSYDKKFGGHTINAIAGFTTLYTSTSFVNGMRRDTSINVPDSPEFWYLGIINANNPTTNGGGGSEGSSVGGFARVGYNYLGKILVNATIRRDGSSKFAPQNRWGTFGSIGAGWIVSNEDFFLRDINNVEFLKLRAAWGLTGNANGFAENLWRPGIQNASTAIFGDNVYSSIQAAYIPDPNLHWETVKGIDLGFDVRALGNRLNAEVTFYNRTTTDILTGVTLPNETRSYFTNLGKITNKGIEVSAGWGDKFGVGLSYRVMGNFSYNNNVVNSIGDNFNFQVLGNGGVNRTITGSSIGHFYGYTQAGIYQSVADMDKQPTFANSLPGDIAYKDINGDGLLTTADRGFIGTPFPPYSFGGSISLDFKNFDLSIEGQGAAGHKIYTQRRTATFAVLNYEANRIHAWTGPGSTNIEPILDNTRGNNFLMSTYYLEPGDYFRIRTLQLGYNLTKGFIAKTRIKNARIYISAQNLKTWSQVTGYSPEPLIGSILGGGADNGSYPVPAIYTFGINVNF